MLFQRWVVAAQFEMSFDEFKARLIKKPINEKEILSDVENILKGWEAEHGTI